MGEKVVKTVLAAAVMGVVASGGAYSAKAVDYKSNLLVEFTPNDEITLPVDPTNPSVSFDPREGPTDPTDPSGPQKGTAGPLSIDYASSLSFGTQKISPVDQVYQAEAQKFGGSRGDGPNYIQVTDNRGTEAGWSLKVKQQGQFTSETDKKELVGAELVFSNGTINTASTSPKPSTVQSTFSLTPDGTGVAEKIMAASAGEGSGTYVLAFGDDASAAKSISLKVPGKSTKYADKYSTTLLWTLEDTPANQ
ncbi:cell surface protein with WxL domain [Listeria floridensis FSL S10-1187]|uniref:Cell surface protein with WxL domain n=1 Tax=Listeria floridensis FSL S10-1187 TaxID=1265817 RepID=A0ABN0RHU3_9LIST|nr:WxL domain-containing protein [Listeria floridensis]EUJ33414.1 cell surface protein with WxL domain [Listeria floridensis FSL S10-1187]